MYFDADDMLMPGIVKDAFDKQKETGVDIVFFGANFTRQNAFNDSKQSTFPVHFSNVTYSLD